MNANELWNRYKRHLCRVPSVDLTLDISRMNFDDGFFAAHGSRRSSRPTRRWTRWRRGRSPTPTRTAWSATTGCARRSWPRRRRSPPRSATRSPAVKAFAADVHSGEIKPPAAAAVHARAVDRHRRLGARAEFVADALGRSRRRQDAAVHFFDNTDPDGIARVLAPLDGQARRDAGRRRSPRAAARPRPATACSWSPTPTARRASTSPSTPSPSPATGSKLDKQAADGRLAGAVPDVGLGRRPHQRDCRPSACCPRPSRASTSTACSPAPRPWTRRPARTTRRRTPPPCSP